jgi:hypothetical protein
MHSMLGFQIISLVVVGFVFNSQLACKVTKSREKNKETGSFFAETE